MIKLIQQSNDKFFKSNSETESFTFSGGEIQVKVPPEKYKDGIVTIQARLRNGNDIIELLNIKDAIDRQYNSSKIILELFYTMFSRQDRVVNKGESFSLKVFTNLINSMNFDKVITYDNHSEVTNALLNNNYEVTQLDIFKKSGITELSNPYDFIISPDAGANKKAFKIAQYLNIPVIQADKVRDTLTGEITRTVVHSDWQILGTTDVLIVDDICDGGRTVIELTKVLRAEMEVNSVDCYFTHGIFSKGYDALYNANIEKIITSDSFEQAVEHNKLQVIELGENNGN